MGILSEQLFHGSGHYFAVGDVVEPRVPRGSMPDALAKAFATTKANWASRYASNRDPYGDDPQGKLFGTVYKVEPIGPIQQRSLGTGEWVSDHGYTVTGVQSYTPLRKNFPPKDGGS